MSKIDCKKYRKDEKRQKRKAVPGQQIEEKGPAKGVHAKKKSPRFADAAHYNNLHDSSRWASYPKPLCFQLPLLIRGRPALGKGDIRNPLYIMWV